MNSGAAERESGQEDLRDSSFFLLEEAATNVLFITSKSALYI